MKVEAWRRQASALGAPAYRITLTARRDDLVTHNMGKGRGPDGSERTYTAAEVEALIPRLRRQNARGFDIYVTPLDPAAHYIVVDDMRDDGRSLRAAGWRPCLVQSTSPGNWQAVIKAPRVVRADEQSIANTLVQTLNQTHGDPAFTGVVHPFRMAGFTNKKAGKGSPFTRLLHAVSEACRQATAWLQRRRDQVDQAAQEQAEAEKRRHAEQAEQIRAALSADRSESLGRAWSRDEAHAKARAEVEGLVSARGWARNESAVDWQVCLRMLRAGWAQDDVAKALRDGSPNLIDRHPSADDYCRRTVANAWATVMAEPTVGAPGSRAGAERRRPRPE